MHTAPEYLSVVKLYLLIKTWFGCQSTCTSGSFMNLQRRIAGRTVRVRKMECTRVLYMAFQNIIEIYICLCYIGHKERHLREQVPSWNPTPKVELPKAVITSYSEAPVLGPTGRAFLFMLISLIEKGKQCENRTKKSYTRMRVAFLDLIRNYFLIKELSGAPVKLPSLLVTV